MSSYKKARSPYRKARSPYGKARSPYRKARSPYGKARSPYGKARSPYGKARSPYRKARSPYRKARSPYRKARSPYRKARSPYSKNKKYSRMEEKFTNIYRNNIWGSSGSGSKFSVNNRWFLNELREIIDKFNIKKIADLGCGDWEIMKHFEFKNGKGETYTGIDCVNYLVNNLNRKFKSNNINFIQQDISENVPKGYDLVIIKDVIQHWDDGNILSKFPEILKNNKYVYCINGYKFIRDPSKNNWKKRELDKKYNYHPLSFDREPFTKFKKYIVESKTRGAKEYILFKYKI